jgi:hypothetical protein
MNATNPKPEVFHVRTRAARWDWLNNAEGKPMSFDSREAAEAEIRLRCSRDTFRVFTSYEIVPSSSWSSPT